MRRILSIALVLVIALSVFTVDRSTAGPKGTFQVGMGAASTTGSAYMISGSQVVTLNATGLIFPSSWTVVLVGFSYGFPTEYEFRSGDESQEFEVKLNYLDGMIGVYTTLQDKGFLYLGGGAALGWGQYEMSFFGDSRIDADIKTKVGFVFGAGMGLNITDSFIGFVNARQRFIKSEMKISDDEDPVFFDYGIGGLEMAVGVGWKFGE